MPKKRLISVLAIILLIATVFCAVNASGFFSRFRKNSSIEEKVNQDLNNSQQSENKKNESTPTSSKYKVEVFAQNLFVPWSIVFTSENRMLVTERNGNLKVIENGEVNLRPLKTFSQISTGAEEGLMGLALDPDYQKNRLIYVSYAYPKGRDLAVKVVQFKDSGDQLTNEKVIIDNIPAAQLHAGCRLKFGPDKKLYITTGDATQKQLAQDKNSLAGKILRINSDGSIPEDNPFTGSPVYSFGHRNPQGIDWHPESGVLFETEHGPSGGDGPAGGDEVNIIKKGENYGWPLVSHGRNREGLIAPKLVFTPAVAPASGMFYKSGKILQFKNNFFFGMLRGEGIMRVIVSDSNPEEIVSYEKLNNISVGRVREIAEGPDGAIYFSSSNQDGRGNVKQNDDKIYRIVRVD